MSFVKLRPWKCRTIFFDLEFYVPECNRKDVGLNYNPWDKKNTLIGGSFLSVNPQVNFAQTDHKNRSEVKSFLIWNYNSERELLVDIFRFIKRESELVRKSHQGRHSSVLCGIGITSSDVPVLFELFKRYNILSNSDAFIFQNELRVLDLSQLALVSFNCKSDYLYPKAKNDILNKYQPGKRFECGSSVWGLYEDKKYTDIEDRVVDEVMCTFFSYKSILKDIRNFKALEAEDKKRAKLKLVEKQECHAN
ncbi:hypothetical protein [Parashewanella tropica]|uniref:hypothetical protein n=1 Tax=Parashewanella tropica TaxID=2547970 RepID=UPI001C553AAB|nr:hypothetical protein [Parashewanella tropica]